MDNISLFTRHSFASCVSNGYLFLAKQLLLLTRVLMPYFTVFALLCVFSLAYNIKLNVAVLAHGGVSIEEILSAMLLHTLVWLTGVVAMSRMFLLFRRMTVMETPLPEDVLTVKTSTWKRTAVRTVQLGWRSVPYTIWALLLNMPGFPVIDPCVKYFSGLSMEYKVLAVVMGVLLIALVAVFLTPLVYTFYCRMMKPLGTLDDVEKMRMFGFRTAYKKGFNHKWKIFSLTLWSMFLFFIVCAVILLPGIVATEAYFSSVEGSVNFGDTALIPTAGYVMMFLTGTIALTFCCLLSVAFAASLMYLFGDIYSKEK